MERVLRVQTVKLDGPGFSSISKERRRKVEKIRSRERGVRNNVTLRCTSGRHVYSY